MFDRRAAIGILGAGGVVGLAGSACASVPQHAPLYGLIGKMTAKPGQRAALAAILIEGISGMPGCLSYIVAEDPADADALWITEAWDSADSHRRSLSLPNVPEAIRKGRPLIAAMDAGQETRPIGGTGLRKLQT